MESIKPPKPHPRLDHLFLGFAVALALGGTCVELAGGGDARAPTIHAIGSDDAFISFRYARNLIEGHGMVFNPGDRVEGYTNFLWVLLSGALLPLAGIDGLLLYVCSVGVVGLLLLLALTYRGSPGSGGAAAFLTAAAPTLWLWSVSGLETIFVVLGQLVAVWAVASGRDRILILALIGLVLLRADGFVTAAVVVAWVLLAKRDARRAIGVALPVAAVVASVFVGRWLYYGEWMPNTYYAKVAGGLADRIPTALRRLVDLAGRDALWIPISALAAHGLRRVWAGGPRALPASVFFAASLLGYWIYVGGDHFGSRFLLILFPLGAWALVQELDRGPGTRRWLPLVVLVAAVIQLWPVQQWRFLEGHWGRYDGLATLGRKLGEEFPGRTLALGAAGKVPYFSNLVTLDMRGLNNRRIARAPISDFADPGHDRSDLEYVLSTQPDLIAAWVRPNLDLTLDLRREIWTGESYRLRLLANTTRESRGEHDILDVTGWSEPEIVEKIEDGYAFAVLERGPGPRRRGGISRRSGTVMAPGR